MHIGVFDVLNKVLLQKLSGDASKKTLFFCRFFGFFAFAFKTLVFLCWPFFLLVLNFCVFFGFLLLLFQKSSCYVVVSVFCCIVFPWFFSVVCVVFLVCVWLLWFFLGGLKGQSRWPKVPPKKTWQRSSCFCCCFLLFFCCCGCGCFIFGPFLLVVLVVVVVLVVIVVFVVLMFCFCCCCCHSCCCCCFGCCSCCCH